jgi:purine-cytosine permease-like protein
MRHTNKELLVKGIKSFGFTVLAMFMGPFLIYQAFKNEGHPFYWPVVILGIACAILAIYLGFRSVKIVMDAIFGEKTKD